MELWKSIWGREEQQPSAEKKKPVKKVLDEKKFLDPKDDTYAGERALVLSAIKDGKLDQIYDLLYNQGKENPGYREVAWQFLRDEFGRRIATDDPKMYADPNSPASQQLRRLRLVSLLLNPKRSLLQSILNCIPNPSRTSIKAINFPTADGKISIVFSDKAARDEFSSKIISLDSKKFIDSNSSSNMISFSIDGLAMVIKGLNHLEPLEDESEPVKLLKTYLTKKVSESVSKSGSESPSSNKTKKPEVLAGHWLDVHDGRPWFAFNKNDEELFAKDFLKNYEAESIEEFQFYREVTFSECQQSLRSIISAEIKKKVDKEMTEKDPTKHSAEKKESDLVKSKKKEDPIPGATMTESMDAIFAAPITSKETKPKKENKTEVAIDVKALLANSRAPLVKVGDTLNEEQQAINQVALSALFENEKYNTQKNVGGQDYRFNQLLSREFPILEVLQDYLEKTNYIFDSEKEIIDSISAYLTEHGFVLNLAVLENTVLQRILHSIFTRILEIDVFEKTHKKAEKIDAMVEEDRLKAKVLRKEKIQDKEKFIENALKSFELAELLAPVPPDGDCFYHSVMINLIHGVLTEEIREDSDTGKAIRENLLPDLEVAYENSFDTKIDLKNKPTLRAAFLTLLRAPHLKLTYEQRNSYGFSVDELSDENIKAINEANLAKLLHHVGMPALRHVVKKYSYEENTKKKVDEAIKAELKLEFHHRFIVKYGKIFGVSEENQEASRRYLAASALLNVDSESGTEADAILDAFQKAYKIPDDLEQKNRGELIFAENLPLILESQFEELWKEQGEKILLVNMKSFHTHPRIMASVPQQIALSQGLQCNLRKSGDLWQGKWENFLDVPDIATAKVDTLYLRQGSAHYDAYLGQLDQAPSAETQALRAQMRVVATNYKQLIKELGTFVISDENEEKEKNELLEKDRQRLKNLYAKFHQELANFISLAKEIDTTVDNQDLFAEASYFQTQLVNFENPEEDFQHDDQDFIEGVDTALQELKKRVEDLKIDFQALKNSSDESPQNSSKTEEVSLNRIFKEYFPVPEEKSEVISDSIALRPHTADSKLLTEATQEAFLSEQGLDQCSDSGQTFQIKGVEQDGEYHMEIYFTDESTENDEMQRMVTAINMLSQIAAHEDIIVLDAGSDLAMLAMCEVYGSWLVGKHPSIRNDEPIIDEIEVNLTSEQHEAYAQEKIKAEKLFAEIIKKHREALTDSDFYRDGREKWRKSLARQADKKSFSFGEGYDKHSWFKTCKDKSGKVEQKNISPKVGGV